MGYQRGDRYGGNRSGGGDDRWRDRGQEERGSYGRGDYGRQQGRGSSDDDRGFFERAGEQVRSWFGDDDDDRSGRYERQRSWGDNRDDQSSFGRSGGFNEAQRGGFASGGVAGSAYGASRGGNDRQTHQNLHDRHYSEWRQRQIDALDRDYEDYRRENQSKFDQEVHGWREKRQSQRHHLGRVKEHMEVVGSDGQHVGTVDKVRGDRIILTKSDPNAGGHHHSIPIAWIDAVDEKVTINKTAEEAQRQWRDEETSRALFEREDQGSEGPHALDRSFSGTYDR